MLKLVFPSLKYRKSYEEARAEYHDFQGEIFISRDSDIVNLSMEERVEKATDIRLGKNLPEGWVKATMFWLVDGDEWLGEISVRHELTPHLLAFGGTIGYTLRPSARGKGLGTRMLALALPEAKKIGFEKVLITCDDRNIASARIIEKNGGVLENIVEREDGDCGAGIPAGKTRRYWIDLSNK